MWKQEPKHRVLSPGFAHVRKSVVSLQPCHLHIVGRYLAELFWRFTDMIPKYISYVALGKCSSNHSFFRPTY